MSLVCNWWLYQTFNTPLNFQVAETVRLKEDFPFQYPHATTTKVLKHGAHLHEGSKIPTLFGHAHTTL